MTTSSTATIPTSSPSQRQTWVEFRLWVVTDPDYVDVERRVAEIERIRRTFHIDWVYPFGEDHGALCVPMDLLGLEDDVDADLRLTVADECLTRSREVTVPVLQQYPLPEYGNYDDAMMAGVL